MADRTGIEWTDATWNPIRGCARVSEGCRNCYAETVAGRFSGPGMAYDGLTRLDAKGNRVWTGKVSFIESALTQPLRWRRPRRIFVNSMSDLFHEHVPNEWIDRIFAVMALAPQHTFQILTKRPERMRKYIADALTPACIAAELLRHAVQWGIKGDALLKPLSPRDSEDDPERVKWPLPNVWLGVSVEDQTAADERIPLLLDMPAAKRFISAEPLLGPLDLTAIQAPRYVQEDYETDWKFSCLDTGDYYWYDCGDGINDAGDGPYRDHRIDWVICGGESGRNARPMHPDWARSLRDQCAGAGVPYFFKQWGEWVSVLDREKDDPDWRAQYSNPALQFGNGRYQFHNLAGGQGFHGERLHIMKRTGKHFAGSLLDGREHKEFPA